MWELEGVTSPSMNPFPSPFHRNSPRDNCLTGIPASLDVLWIFLVFEGICGILFDFISDIHVFLIIRGN